MDFLNNSFANIIEIIIFGAIFFFIEKIKPAEKDTKFFKNDMVSEILTAIINMLIFIPLTVVIASIFINFTIAPLIKHQLFDQHIQALPLTIQILLGAFILDFSTYWRHRFTHNFMWRYHSIHHSAKQITWITSFRLHPIDLLAATMMDSIILYIFGFTGAGFLGALIVLKLMNYITHMNVDLKYSKPMRYILASPHYHRWHHATDKTAYNKNFCSSFPVLDLIFGSYHHPEELPSEYGLSLNEQKNFPEKNYLGWLAYPFRGK